CTLATVEAVAREVEGDAGEVLEGIGSLLDKSLLRREPDPDNEPRYRMLETVREYGLEKLEASGEEDTVRDAHAAWCLRLAETEQAGFADPGPRSTAWMDQMEAELDNLRAAMAWDRDSGNVDSSLRFGAALWLFWWVRGYVTEGGAWLEEMLARGGDASPAVRAAAVHAAGNLARYRGDFEHAVAWHREDLALRRQLGDTRGMALALLCLGLEAFEQGDYDAAIPLLEESQPLFQQVGDRWGLALQRDIVAQIACLRGDYEQAAMLCRESTDLFREIGDVQEGAEVTATLGWIAECQGDVSRSSALYEEAVSASRSVGDKATVAAITVSQGMLACREGDLDQATALLREALVLSRDVDSTRGIAAALLGLGQVARFQGDLRHSVTLFLESLALSHRTSDKAAVVECLEGMAGAVLGLGDAERAARLGGATDAQRATMGICVPPMDRARHERMKTGARDVLGHAAFTAAWAAGQALTLEQAVAEALAFEASSIESRAQAAQNATSLSKGISPRELEVLGLLVEGNSDREIAEQLFVSRRTVTTHTGSLFSKLGVTNRVQAATVAIRLGLI
ncbi:MAG TPA: tetratricopeptide repeat protein, partial [Chloroflexota bacterium]|nr:tetratricopeptide repeat protein [Chloroflexota bacterium]